MDQGKAHLVIVPSWKFGLGYPVLKQRGKTIHLPSGLRNGLSAVLVAKIDVAGVKKPIFPTAQVPGDWDCLSGDNQDSR